jgi:2-polyprenyl-3-methyl-5-hydroxy-6-metoxy-1,4-benzoquinol methylase
MSEKQARLKGSIQEFEDDWQRVLEEQDAKYLVYPSEESVTQVNLLEWIKVQQIIELLRKSGIKDARSLEFGCGAAGTSLYLANQGLSVNICDISEKAIEVANYNRDYHSITQNYSSSVVGDVLRLPYKDNSFDVVMSFGLLEHFELTSLKRLMSESVRVLAPGGLFIADIVPGPERMNVRTLGLVFNYIVSVIFHIIRGKISKVPELFRLYFDYYYESTYDDEFWGEILLDFGLKDVQVDVCRPFPLLSLPQRLEENYTIFMRRLIQLHQWFDRTNNWFTRRWGWMYLASGVKIEKGATN